MSYSGSVEFLCEQGHRSVIDCWDEEPEKCRCGAKIAYRHSIDHTNGVVEDDPSTMPAPVTEIGYDDIWKEDHHGNKFAVKAYKFRPGNHWRKI